MEPTRTTLKPPRYKESGPLRLAGIPERYTPATTGGIPAQWQRLVPHLGHIPGQIGAVTCGVVSNTEDGCDHLCGVFLREQHRSGIQATWKAIWNQWTPASGARVADAPELECYTEAFNAITGAGGVEIWIPVEG